MYFGTLPVHRLDGDESETADPLIRIESSPKSVSSLYAKTLLPPPFRRNYLHGSNCPDIPGQLSRRHFQWPIYRKGTPVPE